MSTSRGFASLGLILVLIIGLAAFGGVGWYVSKQSSAPQQPTVETASTTQTQMNPLTTTAKKPSLLIFQDDRNHELVTFKAEGLQKNLYYNLSFGDGSSSVSQIGCWETSPSGPSRCGFLVEVHRYASAGTYTVKLMTNSHTIAIKTVVVDQIVPNLLPGVGSAIHGPTMIESGQIGTWTMQARQPPAASTSPLQYLVDWGDKSTPTKQASPAFTHIYTTPGQYRLTLTVTNQYGSSVDNTLVTVRYR